MDVYGTLDVEGTESEPVRFTGQNEEEAGEWGQVVFWPGSGASVVDHAEFAYGGNDGYYRDGMVEIEESSPTIENSVFHHSLTGGISVADGGSPEIASNEIHARPGYPGISYSSAPHRSGEVNIHGNHVSGGRVGISVSESYESTILGKSLGGNVVTGTTEKPVVFYGSQIPGNVTGNTVFGNAEDVIFVSGNVGQSQTWKDGGSPVRIDGGVDIDAGKTLTIEKGVLLQRPNMNVYGTLDVEGTESEPVVFTGQNEKEAGEWSQLVFWAGSGASVVDHAEFAYGGNAGYYRDGTVEIRESSPTIKNSTIRKSAGLGILVRSGTPTIEYNRFRGNPRGMAYWESGKLSAPNNDWDCLSGPKPAGCGEEVSENVDWKPAIRLPEPGGHCRGGESQCGRGADPVSLATGQLDYSHRDLVLPNKSAEPLEFDRAYNSGSDLDSGLGPGWTQTGLVTASEIGPGEVLVQRPDGRQDIFQKEGATYESPGGFHDHLRTSKGVYILEALDGTIYRFDESGRIAAVLDDHGLETAYAYNSSGRLATITDPSGQTLSFSYNGSNHIAGVKDSTGREVSFTYNEAGELATVTDALSGVTKYTYGSNHHLLTITDPRGHVILTNTYNGQGEISEQEDGVGGIWKLAYSVGKTVVTEPDGGESTYRFDSQDRVSSETDPLGHKTTIAYNPAGDVEEVERPGSAVWHYEYDRAGNLTAAEDPEGGQTTWVYDSQNHPTEYTDSRGKTWEYEWSAANDLEAQIDPEGGETTATYDAAGEPLTVTDPDGHTTELEYDEDGNRTAVTDPLGHDWNYGYDARGYLTSKAAPGLEAESFGRDSLGDLLSRTTPEGHKTKFEYDANGLLTELTDPAGHSWKVERNAMERPVVYEDPLGHRAELSYDDDLNVTGEVNRRGAETKFRYNLADELTEVEGPEGESWGYGYDARGNRDSATNPRGHATAYSFDLLDRLTKAEEPLGATSEYAYDAAGDLTSFTDPDGNETSLGYDDLGRLTAVERPLGEDTSYGYDPAGNLIAKTSAETSLEYEYDAADQLLSVGEEGSALRSFAYGPDHRLAEATDVEGRDDLPRLHRRR